MSRGFLEVRTKLELEKAINGKIPHIIVKGDLAEKLNRAQTIKSLSVPAIAALGAALAATPFTAGVSGVVGMAAVATLTGLEIVAITAVVFLGLALILKITEGYDRTFTAKADGIGEASMDLKAKKP